MQIRLAEYTEGVAVAVSGTYESKGLDLEFVDLHYTAPIVLEGTVERGPDTVSFRGTLKSTIEQICGRCLKKVEGPVQETFSFYYEIQDKDVIETIDDLREVLILDHGAVYLCSEDCRGLCPQCGSDLNETGCGCSKLPHSGALGSIKEFWKPKKKGE